MPSLFLLYKNPISVKNIKIKKHKKTEQQKNGTTKEQKNGTPYCVP